MSEGQEQIQAADPNPVDEQGEVLVEVEDVPAPIPAVEDLPAGEDPTEVIDATEPTEEESAPTAEAPTETDAAAEETQEAPSKPPTEKKSAPAGATKKVTKRLAAKKKTTAKAKKPAAANKKTATITSPKKTKTAAKKRAATSPKSKKIVAAKKSSAPIKKRTPPRRSPDVELVGGWPKGWFMRVYKRDEGETAGRKDRYFYSPKKEHKLRSVVEVKYFLKGLKQQQTKRKDEDEAKRYAKAMVLAKGKEGQAKKILKAMK
jgi:hypothetical protein